MSSISQKLKRTFLLVVVISLLASNLLIFFLMRDAYGKEILKNYKNIGQNISSQIGNNLDFIINLGQTICTDTGLRELIRHIPQEDCYQRYSTEQNITNLLASYSTLNNTLVDDIYFICRDGSVISRGGYYQSTLSDEWYLRFEETKRNSGFTDVHKVTRRENFSVSDEKRVITYVAGVFSISGGSYEERFLGRIMINIKLESLLKEAEGFSGYEYALYSSEGRILGQNDETISLTPQELKQESVVLKKGGNSYYKTEINHHAWIMVSRIPADLVNKSLLFIGLVVAVIILITIFVTGIVVKVLSVSITEPLEKLTDCMSRFSSGDFQAYARISSGDEVEKIADVYNEMVDNIQQYMQENVEKEKEKKESEIRFLMAQIKPHFIYNTLNCIIYLARQGKDRDIIRFTRSFISVLQSTIKKKPKDLVPLLSEMEYLKDYLTLIKYRYGYFPELSWEIQEECQNCKIPAMILQPIVENCVFHGLSEKVNDGKIKITARIRQGTVRISVKDNGRGIKKEVLEELMVSIEKHEPLPEWTEHIGLMNVNERLKLCYGEESGLHIESSYGKGTLVWFQGEKI